VAPYSMNGLLQVHFEIPLSAPKSTAVPALVTIGNYVTQPAIIIAVQQNRRQRCRVRERLFYLYAWL
jgi:hypothetical protein